MKLTNTLVIIFAILCILLSYCTKEHFEENTKLPLDFKPQSCDFLNGNYNVVGRMLPEEQVIAFRRGSKIKDTDRDGITDTQDNCSVTFNPFGT